MPAPRKGAPPPLPRTSPGMTASFPEAGQVSAGTTKPTTTLVGAGLGVAPYPAYPGLVPLVSAERPTGVTPAFAPPPAVAVPAATCGPRAAVVVVVVPYAEVPIWTRPSIVDNIAAAADTAIARATLRLWRTPLVLIPMAPRPLRALQLRP